MIILKTLAETILSVYLLVGAFQVEGDKLLVKGLETIPDDLRAAIQAHKPNIYRYVGAFPGGIWPPISKRGEV